MAQGDGLHVEEANVHLGLDVDALPDLRMRTVMGRVLREFLVPVCCPRGPRDAGHAF